MQFITPTPSNDTAEETRQLLWSHLEQLTPMVKAYFPADSNIVRAFNCNAGDNVPTIAQLETALDLFYSMPADIQREALNGWKPHPQRPSLECYRGRDSNGQMRCGLWIDGEPDEVIKPAFDVLETNSIAPVQVFIQEGATREDVVNVLHNIAAKVEGQWEKIIAESPENLTLPGNHFAAAPEPPAKSEPRPQSPAGHPAEPAERIPDPERFGVRTILLMRLARIIAGVQWQCETPPDELCQDADLVAAMEKLADGPLKQAVDELLALASEHFGAEADGGRPLDAGDEPMGAQPADPPSAPVAIQPPPPNAPQVAPAAPQFTPAIDKHLAMAEQLRAMLAELAGLRKASDSPDDYSDILDHLWQVHGELQTVANNLIGNEVVEVEAV